MFFSGWSFRPNVTALPRLQWPRSRIAAPRHWSLRWKLLAFLIISLLPILASAYWLVNDGASEAKAAILRRSFGTAQSIEDDVSRSIAATTRLLSMVAEQPPVAGADSKLATPLLEKALASYPELLSIAAVDDHGRVFATALLETEGARDVSDRKYFQDVMLSGWPTVSQTRLISRRTGLPTAVIGVPIKDRSGIPTGVLIGELSLQNLQTRLAAASDPEHGEVILVDADGAVLVHPDWGRHAVQASAYTYAYAPVVRAASRGEPGALELDNPETGVRDLVVHVPVVGTSWTLTVVYPVAKAYSAAWMMLLRSLLILLAGILAATIIALLLLRWISQPVYTLRSRVRGRLDGNLGAQLEKRDSDELQQLADAFDSLVDTLDSRAAQLAELQHEIDQRNQRVTRLSIKLARAQEEERKKIAMDMHDSIAQLLATALFEAQGAEQCLASDLQTAQHKIHSTLDLMQQISSEVRCTLFELYPPRPERGKLLTWLRRYLSKYGVVSGLHFELEVAGTPVDLDPALEMTVCHVAQESLQNVKKHAQASSVHCRLSFEPGMVRLVVRDDGQGFPGDVCPTDLPGHMGLASMEARAQAVGGSIRIDSMPGLGTTVTLELPYSEGARQRAGSNRRRAEVEPSLSATV